MRLLLLYSLLSSVPALACSTYLCMPAGKDLPTLKVDMKTMSVFELNEDVTAVDLATATEVPILTNRFGTTQFGSTSYRYFEVIAYNGTRLLDIRIYHPKPVASCTRGEYAADILTSNHSPQLAK